MIRDFGLKSQDTYLYNNYQKANCKNNQKF